MTLNLLLALLPGVVLLAAASAKWTLPLRQATLVIGAASLVTGSVGAALLPGTTSWWLQTILMAGGQGMLYTGIIAWLFYRDPERRTPDDPDVLVSPADGKVIYIRQVDPGGTLLSEKAGRRLMLEDLSQSSLGKDRLWQIGISMVFTDVHVNRAPIAGEVTLLRHRPGKFLSLRDEEALGVNERQTIVIDNGRVRVGLVQIASRLVRRIVAYVSPGQHVGVGQRIGMIKFGSQVDMFVPMDSLPALEVQVGQRLVAGETPMGRLVVAPVAR